MPRLIELSVAYKDDRNSAIDCFKKYWAGMVPAMFNLNLYTPKMSELNGSVVGMDTILKKTCISTDPDDHVELALLIWALRTFSSIRRALIRWTLSLNMVATCYRG